jgi:predicted methyltransferase
MTRWDEYRRFAGECLKMARTADEQYQAIFQQLKGGWFALVQKEKASPGPGRSGGPEDQIS